MGQLDRVIDALHVWRDHGWDDLSRKLAYYYESIWPVHIATTVGRCKIATLGTYDVARRHRPLKASFPAAEWALRTSSKPWPA